VGELRAEKGCNRLNDKRSRERHDCATLPPTEFQDPFKHPLTDQGFEQFRSDWARAGQSIF
jgi:hypothetical protein